MKCYSDDPLVVPIDGLHIGAKLQIVEEPVEIMDREVKRLKQSRFPIVKVRWNSRRGPEFIWEREDRFQKKYPHLFTNRASSSNATSLSLEDKAHLTGGDYNTSCFRVIDVVNKSAMYLLITLPETHSAATHFWGCYMMCHQCGVVGSIETNVPNPRRFEKKKKAISSVQYLQGLNGSRKLKPRALNLDDIYEIDLHDSNTNNSSMYVTSNKRAKLNLDSTLLWHCRLGHISKKQIEKLQHDGLLKSTDHESFDKCVSCMFELCRDKEQATSSPSLTTLVVRGYPKEMMGYSFYYPPKNKVLVAWNVEFFKNSLITQEARGSLEDLEIIQDEDMHPSENTSLHHDKYDQEIDEPQSDIIPVYSRKVSYVLGIKIYIDRSRQLIGLCQSAYVEKILKRFNMENSKREIIPMKDRPKLSKSQGASTPNEVKRMQRVPYASTVGSIMVACYNDVGYLIDVEDSKYQTGYLFILNGGAIDSKSTEQSILVTSSAEAEYIAALDASKEAV
ncbi:retrotransposon protein, putative, ty1-copia subclass [Tanacetum coccineum]